MVMSIPEYLKQAKIVKETIQILDDNIKRVHSLLEVNPHDARLRRDLRMLMLDMKITLNELEQIEKILKSQHISTNSSKSAFSAL